MVQRLFDNEGSPGQMNLPKLIDPHMPADTLCVIRWRFVGTPWKDGRAVAQAWKFRAVFNRAKTAGSLGYQEYELMPADEGQTKRQLGQFQDVSEELEVKSENEKEQNMKATVQDELEQLKKQPVVKSKAGAKGKATAKAKSNGGGGKRTAQVLAFLKAHKGFHTMSELREKLKVASVGSSLKSLGKRIEWAKEKDGRGKTVRLKG